MNDDTGIGEFRVARGGPFYELQRQLGLIRETHCAPVPEFCYSSASPGACRSF
jgi:hypothetical protein